MSVLTALDATLSGWDHVPPVDVALMRAAAAAIDAHTDAVAAGDEPVRPYVAAVEALAKLVQAHRPELAEGPDALAAVLSIHDR